ncbi:hypothetical protein QSJ18_06105 [Gordonia sp. ABSL1-1]|uniref:hypothetical protein n=1 Tax=Gordonia sp. ABSL1-1 TaxID=3053923 RepID=UPI002574846D|nr:hypothetical protein [Gordonia sp. ABSL1-1]MDL9936311.1 hypothetical protein [Gordonia sp. ABSL1-1]
MMLLVRLIDLFVEYVKLLFGVGYQNTGARVVAWLFLIAVIATVIGLIAWGVALIPDLIDVLNGTG